MRWQPAVGDEAAVVRWWWGWCKERTPVTVTEVTPTEVVTSDGRRWHPILLASEDRAALVRAGSDADRDAEWSLRHGELMRAAVAAERRFGGRLDQASVADLDVLVDAFTALRDAVRSREQQEGGMG